MPSEHIKKLHIAAQQHINRGQLKPAHQACVQILKIQPKHADAHFLLGMIALNMQQMTKAIELIRFAINQSPNNPEYYAFHARALSLVNRYPEAESAVQEALKLGTDNPMVNDTLAVVLSRLGEHKKAVPLFNKAIKQQPNNPSFYYNLAASLKFTGEFEQAQAAYEKVIELKPNYYQAHSALAELQVATKEQNNLVRLKAELDKVANNVDGKLHLCHAMAKEFECLHEYNQALHILKRGNAAKKNQLGYDIEQDKMLFTAMKQLFDHEFAAQQVSDCQSTQPIFVLGMPRSGTTLVDRILSSHSNVISVGESQNFGVELKKLAKTPSRQVLDLETIQATKNIDFTELSKRYLKSTQPTPSTNASQTSHFVDKMPLNFLYIGLIKKALPNAKIIILDRHPMDVCLSNFRTLFAVNFSYYNYAYDLKDSGQYFALFKDLMKFWQSIYGDSLLEVSYEKLVEKPEQEIRKILSYCNLDWQESCLNFHENPASVSTASSVQVRQPMNSKSIGRWQKYGNELDELQQYLTEVGLM
ncbi:tetratricopeptide repeat-containing sulfotransferase family protein [Paraglaciecola sp.]|uniref:tetratricopeptide repeat-containing sulfotransferase family protein n=1 Tax=Paraglaciecola sp. TaxID=1920173 RepID=UPI003EF5BE3C